jgi:hypothetical protein
MEWSGTKDGRFSGHWALGLEELRSYELTDWEGRIPYLAVKAIYRLPDKNGHDLQPVPKSNDLVITTDRHVYLFDRDKQEFRLHPKPRRQGTTSSP